MNGAIDLSWGQMFFAYLYLLLTLIICHIREIKRGSELVIAALRMTVQLILAGFLLTFILQRANIWITVFVMLVMEVFAVFNVFQRVKSAITLSLKKAAAISLAGATVLSILYFLILVVRPDPWYNAQYLIPLGGMIIGNAMTGVALAMNQLIDVATTQKDTIEAALILGAKPDRAVKPFIDKIFDDAILPTLNNMVSMGIVILPGMMTGQILSGSPPNTAIKYQIAIMLAILGTTSVCVLTFLSLASRSLFNEKQQLVFADQLLELEKRD